MTQTAFSVTTVADALFAYNTADALHSVVHDGGYEGIAEAAVAAVDPIKPTRVDAHCPRCGQVVSVEPVIQQVQLADRYEQYAIFVSFETAYASHYCAANDTPEARP